MKNKGIDKKISLDIIKSFKNYFSKLKNYKIKQS